MEKKNVDAILSYRLRNSSYNHEPKQIERLEILFTSGTVTNTYTDIHRHTFLQEMFGLLETQGQRADYKLRRMTNPVILSTIDSPFEEYDIEVLCVHLRVGKKKNWVSGHVDNTCMIALDGSVLKDLKGISEVY